MMLKPCPFCGGEAEKAHLDRRFSVVFGLWRPSYIRCQVCHATSPVKVQMKEAELSWNRRKKEVDSDASDN